MADVRALVMVVHLCRTMGQLRCVHCTGAQVAQTQVSSNVTGPLSHPLGNRMAGYLHFLCSCVCMHVHVCVCVHVHVGVYVRVHMSMSTCVCVCVCVCV